MIDDDDGLFGVAGHGRITGLHFGDRASHEASVGMGADWPSGNQPAGRDALDPTSEGRDRDLLEPGESLADASTWADDIVSELPKTAPWHYVDVPLDEPCYDIAGSSQRARMCRRKDQEFRPSTGPKAARSVDERCALRFLIHSSATPQPIHVGDNHDRGGNDTQVRFYDLGTNMHRLWDTDIVEQMSKSEEAWLDVLVSRSTPGAREPALKGSVEDWATESLLAARAAYNVPETGQRLKPGQKVDNRYYNANLRLCANGSIKLACDWRWCSTKRFRRSSGGNNEAGSPGGPAPLYGASWAGVQSADLASLSNCWILPNAGPWYLAK